LRRRLHVAIAGLSPTQRQAALLWLDGASTPRQIAERAGWSYRQAKDAWNHARQELRHALSRDEPADVLTRLRALDALTAAEATPDPGVVAERADLRARIEQVVGQLPPLQRQVARLRVAGLSATEIAERTGLTPRQIQRAWSSARPVIEQHAEAGAAPQPRPDRNWCGVSVEEVRARVLRSITNTDATGQAELRARVDRAAEGLCPAQREIARLRLDGLGLTEIAEQTGRTYTQAKKTWTRAKQNLTRALAGAAEATGSDRQETGARPSRPASSCARVVRAA
jgi:DNA-directed RNA polymerase specialized sigma24 family protein